jgi:hypothetical protein
MSPRPYSLPSGMTDALMDSRRTTIGEPKPAQRREAKDRNISGVAVS